MQVQCRHRYDWHLKMLTNPFDQHDQGVTEVLNHFVGILPGTCDSPTGHRSSLLNCKYTCRVGQELRITPEATNSIYWKDLIYPGLVFARRGADIGSQYAWVADKNWRAERVIDLATKTDKYGLAFRKPSLGQSDSPPAKRTKDIHVSPMTERHLSPQASGLLKMAQMDHTNNAQTFKLAKAITPMILSSMKIVVKLVVEKLSSLYARVDVLEKEVADMREEIYRWKDLIPPMDIDLNVLVVGLDSLVANRSPPND
ncbi:hypothetical protein HAX54_027558 [Datura stramonium]|uniref:Uncharacterized protein n=1 Tax=Datura stramonium TaxID=4076 RepID=A0ABS8V471_DATST|nr:hypothetical protein [Datura stramonium]